MSNNNQHPEEFIDISSGKPVAAGQHFSDDTPERKSSAKKPIIIIASVAATLVVAAGVAGFVFLNQSKPAPQPEEPKVTEPVVFTFEAGTVVSGVDISGKTVEQAKLLLEKNTESFITPITFNISINGKDYQLKESDFNYTFNIDEVVQQAKADAEGGQKTTGEQGHTYTVTATVKQESIQNNVEKLCEEIDTAPKNAYVTEFHPYEDVRFEFAEATSGIKVNDKDLTQKLTEAFSRGNSVSELTAEVEITEAEVDAETLSKKIVKLSTYQTYSSNSENGTSNMGISLDACNGSIIEPDGVWSFNECTGDSNLESLGYKPAGVILEGELTEGIGGGICQSSSTIYNAAIRANLDIEERYNHKWTSGYVPAGMDATIDYPNLDLKLSNPTDYQMFLECRLDGRTLYATFWGVKTGGWDEIRVHNELGETESKTYTVREWRVYYDSDDKEIDREELYKSVYDNDHGVSFDEADNDSQVIYEDDSKEENTAYHSYSITYGKKNDEESKSEEQSSSADTSDSDGGDEE